MPLETQLVTIEQVRNRTGLDLADGSAELEVAETIADGVVEALEEHAGVLWQRQFVEDHLDHPSGDLFLRTKPVVSVASLERVASDGTTTTVDPVTYAVTSWGVVDAPSGDLRVTYTAGKDAPHVAKMLALRAIARQVKAFDEDEEGVSNIRQEGYAVELITDVLTEDELAMIPPRRRIRG